MWSLIKFFFILSKFAIFPTKIDSKMSTIRFSIASPKTALSACLISIPYIGCLIWFLSSSSECRRDFWEAFKKTYEKIDIAVMLVFPFSLMTPLCPIIWSWMTSKPFVSVPEFSLSSRFTLPKYWLKLLLINILMLVSFLLTFLGLFLSVTRNMQPYSWLTLANLFFPLLIPTVLTVVFTYPGMLSYFVILQMMCEKLHQAPPSLSARAMWARNTMSTFERLQRGSNFAIFMFMLFR